MSKRICGVCKTCKGKIEPGNNSGLCEGCRLDTFIPDWYERAEEYRFSDVDKHYNATKSPRTGVEVLDIGCRSSVLETAAKVQTNQLERMSYLDTQAGINTSGE